MVRQEADSVDTVRVTFESGKHPPMFRVLNISSTAPFVRPLEQTSEGTSTPTAGFHSEIYLPAPKARSPEGDQSAAAGCLLPPTAMYEQSASIVALIVGDKGGS